MVRVEKPSAALQPFVRHYLRMKAHLPTQTLLQPVPAHTWSAIEFTFGDPFEVWVDGEPRHETAHPVAVIGAQTHRRVHLALHGRVETFVIVFEPGGLSRFFKVPPRVLTNQHFEGHAVLGGSVDALRCRLGESSSFAERIRIADDYLLLRAAAQRSLSDVTAFTRALLDCGGSLRIARIAEQAGLGVRQFERRFISQIGMPPKVYARVARFEAALKSKKRSPRLRWTDIAHGLGYHDQMHMVHDFQQLSGSTPSAAAPRLDMFVENDIDDDKTKPAR